MENHKTFGCFTIFCAIVVAIIFIKGLTDFDSNSLISTNTYREYKCDVHHFKLRTDIQIEKDGESVGLIKGNILKLITDPLEMIVDGKRIAYASDNYNFIRQDDHAIVSNDEYQFTMHGDFAIVGHSYTLLDKDNKRIAHIHFNAMNTSGILYDNDKNILAEYSSDVLRADYNVRIYTNDLDDNALLLFFASYRSDYYADS